LLWLSAQYVPFKHNTISKSLINSDWYRWIESCCEQFINLIIFDYNVHVRPRCWLHNISDYNSTQTTSHISCLLIVLTSTYFSLKIPNMQTTYSQIKPFFRLISAPCQVQEILFVKNNIFEQINCDEYSNRTQSLNIWISSTFILL